MRCFFRVLISKFYLTKFQSKFYSSGRISLSYIVYIWGEKKKKKNQQILVAMEMVELKMLKMFHI